MIARQLCAAAIFAATASPALADVPFLTDDPFLIEPGHLEIAWSLDHLALSGADAAAVSVSYDAAVSEGAQVGVAALALDAGQFDIGELSANAKLAVIPASEGRFGLAFRPSVAIPLGTGVRHAIGAVIPLYGGLAIGEWSLYGGGGYAINTARDGGRYPFGGLVASRNVGAGWTVGGELAGRIGNDQSPGLLEIGAGAAVALGRDFTLAGAIYRTLSHRGPNGDGRAFVTLRYAR